ncbi:MAG: hypothetical protein VR68_05965 [Peptococcaceae bacterium BRH_c4a]|nr:MAG: hypothetical protein VR68_05965 [Peptococcaceae bacterium BRH_c4a]
MEPGKISCSQLFYMIINLVTATAIVFLPGLTAVEAGRDSWIAPLLATFPGIYLALIIATLGKRFPGQTLIQYLQSILGAWPGKIFGVFYIFFFLHTNGVIVREFGELMVGLIMPRTPLIVFHAILLFLCAWAIRGGLEIPARIIEFTLPAIIIVFMIMLLLTAQEMDIKNLLPVLENGIKPVIRSSLDPIGWRGEIILLAMFLPFLERPGEGGRCAIWAVIVIGIILSFDAMINTAVLGTAVSHLTFPTFSLVRMVSVGNFLERIESVMVAIWIIGLFGKITWFYYAVVLGSAQLLNLKDYRPLVLPLGVLLAALSIRVAGNVPEVAGYIIEGFPPFAFLFEYIIPTVLLAVAWARGLKNTGRKGTAGGKTA